MSRTIKPEVLADALHQEMEEWRDDVVDRVNDVGKKSIRKLVQLTKATAPTRFGSFRRHITFKEETLVRGVKKYVWGVKAPKYRITHLLVHGHAKRDGGRTAGDPFLQNAMDAVLPEYEKAVREAIEK